MSNIVVPPGGFAGFSQMTPASRASLFPPGSRRASTSGKRRKKGKRAKTARRKAGRKIKFGSPAWRKKYKLGKKKR